MTRTIFDTTNEEEFIQWSLRLEEPNYFSRLFSLVTDSEDRDKRSIIDNWIADNISWLIKHIEVIDAWPNAEQVINFEILGYKWSALTTDPYYNELTQLVEKKS